MDYKRSFRSPSILSFRIPGITSGLWLKMSPPEICRLHFRTSCSFPEYLVHSLPLLSPLCLVEALSLPYSSPSSFSCFLADIETSHSPCKVILTNQWDHNEHHHSGTSQVTVLHNLKHFCAVISLNPHKDLTFLFMDKGTKAPRRCPK